MSDPNKRSASPDAQAMGNKSPFDLAIGEAEKLVGELNVILTYMKDIRDEFDGIVKELKNPSGQ